MSVIKYHWRELISKSEPNTEAREVLISKMAERLDWLESFLESVLFNDDKIREITESVLSDNAKKKAAKR